MSVKPEDRALIGRLRDTGRVVLPASQKVSHVQYCEQGGRQKDDGTWERGNFTIALVTIDDGGRRELVTVGVAKRNCNDDGQNDRRGRDIALTRALRGDARPLI